MSVRQFDGNDKLFVLMVTVTFFYQCFTFLLNIIILTKILLN